MLPANEPKSAEAVLQWVEARTRANDRFARVAEKYDSHRAAQGCYDVYPYSNGALLGTLATAIGLGVFSKSAAASVTALYGSHTAPAREV